MDSPRAWGPDIAHALDCGIRVHRAAECTCPKQDYCEDCDAQHDDGHCPRTVLDDILDALD